MLTSLYFKLTPQNAPHAPVTALAYIDWQPFATR